MANFYGKNRDTDFAASKLMSFGKSFSRMNGQPLDESEVWYNKADLEAFAAGNSAYVGMKLVYVDETHQKVYQYSVQYDGTVKEIGVAPLGDGKSIAVDAETGTVSLKGIDALTFEREVDVLDENGQPTGEKTTEEVKFQPLMTKDGLVWVEPSKTTVEGLATLIEGLNVKVTAIENKVGVAAKPETTEGAGDAVAATGLYALIDAEAARALAAEQALDDAIKAIDFVDADELEEAIKDFTTKTYVDTELGKKVNATDYATDKKALEDEDTAIREIAEEAQQLIKDFLTGTDTDEVVNKLKEIQAELDKLGDVVDLEAALALKADLDYVNTELAKKQDVIAEGTYATPGDVATAKGEAIADAEGKIAAAEGRAATDAQNKADAAKQAAIADADGKLANKADKATTLEGYGITDAYTATETDAAIAAKIREMTGGESAADVLSALNDYKKVNDREIYGDTFVREHTGEDGVYNPGTYNATSRIDALEAVGAQANVIEAVVAKTGNTLLGTAEIATAEKTVTIDDSKIVAAIADAKKAGTDAQSAANGAQATANTNADNITALTNRVKDVEDKANSNSGAITGLDGRIAANEAAIATINSTTLPGKADKSVVEGLSTSLGTLEGTVSGHTQSIATINETLGNKAESSTVTGLADRVTANEQAIAGLSNYDDTAVKALIQANTDNIALKADQTALTAEAERAAAAEKKNADAIALLAEQVGNVSNIMNFRGVIDTEAEGFNADEPFAQIADPKNGDVVLYGEQEYVYNDGIWVLFGDATGNANAITELTKRVEANETAVKTTLPGAMAQALADAKAYTDQEIGKIVLPTAAQQSILGLIKGTENKVNVTDGEIVGISTDLLFQGANELILNGGNADVATNN